MDAAVNAVAAWPFVGLSARRGAWLQVMAGAAKDTAAPAEAPRSKSRRERPEFKSNLGGRFGTIRTSWTIQSCWAVCSMTCRRKRRFQMTAPDKRSHQTNIGARLAPKPKPGI